MNPQWGANTSVRVRVPATSANLGPGFDTLGLALTLYNRFQLERLEEGGRVLIEATGPEADRVPTGRDNLFVQAAEATRIAAGLPPVGWRVRLETEIPLGGG